MSSTKEKIRKISAMQLCSRVTRLQFDEDAGCNIPGDKEEIVILEKVLRRGLVKMLGRDFYPPESKKPKPKKPKPEFKPKKAAIKLTKEFKEKFGASTGDIAATTRSVKSGSKVESGPKFNFKITITSSIGSKVAEKTVKVGSKGEAEAEAQEVIKQLGLKKATYKIS